MGANFCWIKDKDFYNKICNAQSILLPQISSNSGQKVTPKGPQDGHCPAYQLKLDSFSPMGHLANILVSGLCLCNLLWPDKSNAWENFSELFQLYGVFIAMNCSEITILFRRLNLRNPLVEFLDTDTFGMYTSRRTV